MGVKVSIDVTNLIFKLLSMSEICELTRKEWKMK